MVPLCDSNFKVTMVLRSVLVLDRTYTQVRHSVSPLFYVYISGMFSSQPESSSYVVHTAESHKDGQTDRNFEKKSGLLRGRALNHQGQAQQYAGGWTGWIWTSRQGRHQCQWHGAINALLLYTPLGMNLCIRSERKPACRNCNSCLTATRNLEHPRFKTKAGNPAQTFAGQWMSGSNWTGRQVLGPKVMSISKCFKGRYYYLCRCAFSKWFSCLSYSICITRQLSQPPKYTCLQNRWHSCASDLNLPHTNLQNSPLFTPSQPSHLFVECGWCHDWIKHVIHNHGNGWLMKSKSKP